MKFINLACYLSFGVAVHALSPGEWTAEQYVAYFAALGLMCIVDIRSYRDGLKRGTEIANEVLHDLCKEKKIAVVPNVDR